MFTAALFTDIETTLMPMDKEWIKKIWYIRWAFQVALVVKNPSTSAGDVRNVSSIPGSGRSPEEGYGNPLQYSCLENPMDSGTRQATVHGVARVRYDLATQLQVGPPVRLARAVGGLLT